MRDPTELQQLLAAARRFKVEHRGAVFHLHLPTEQELRRLYRTHLPKGPEPAPDAPGALGTKPTDELEPAILDALQRDTVLAALDGWNQVTDSMVLGEESSGEPVAFDAGLAAEWLAADAPLTDVLTIEVFGRIRQRRAAREADAKN